MSRSMKKIGFLFLFACSSLLLSAADVNIYYIVTAKTLNGRSAPNKSAAKAIQYPEYEVLYITDLSQDSKWGYVRKDNVWVSMSYIRPLTEDEVDRYMALLKRKGITPESELYNPAAPPEGSKPLRALLWLTLGIVVIMTLCLLFTDRPLRSIGVLYATVLMSAAVLIVMSYAQFVLCWGLRVVGWIDHYILFGWLVDAFANGILSIIPKILDLPTFGLYGLVAGLLPMAAFYGIGKLFENYPFASWVTYAFQLAMLLAVFVLNDDSVYRVVNQILQLDGVNAISSLAQACDRGEYANRIFIKAFNLATFTLLVPKYYVDKIYHKYLEH